MNDDHADSVLAYARGLAGIADATGARLSDVDRYGIEMVVTSPAGERRVRVAFEAEVRTREEARRALVEMDARARGG